MPILLMILSPIMVRVIYEKVLFLMTRQLQMLIKLVGNYWHQKEIGSLVLTILLMMLYPIIVQVSLLCMLLPVVMG
jgi:hypothetical protein